jgi:hypothetical protein
VWEKPHADKAYDSSALRRALRARRITPRIARREIDCSAGWDGTAGWSSAPFPGYWAAAASSSALSGGRTSSRARCTWPVP